MVDQFPASSDGGGGAPSPAILNGVVIWDGTELATNTNVTYSPGSELITFTGATPHLDVSGTAGNTQSTITIGSGGTGTSSLFITSVFPALAQIVFNGGAGIIRFLDSGDSFSSSISFTAPTANRSFILPNADSNPVQPASASAGQYVSGVSSSGVIAFSTLANQSTKLNFSGAAGGAKVAGKATLSGGTVTVSTTAYSSTCIVLLTDLGGGTLLNIGSAYVDTAGSSAGTNFVIKSTSATDNNVVGWLIVEP